MDIEIPSSNLIRIEINYLYFSLIRWVDEGIESLLFDDDKDDGSDVSEKSKQTLSISDVLDALQIKYDRLRKRLFSEMLKLSMGE